MMSDCCGAGGLFMVLNNEASDKIGKKEVQQAMGIGLSAFVTECPAC